LPEHLERIEQVVKPGTLTCPCGCGQMHMIGEDRSERLDIVPAKLRVIVTVRPKYACRNCTDGVTQAHFLGNSANVIFSRIASSATLA
jgi:transposase